MKEFIEEYIEMKESYNKLQYEKHNKYVDTLMKARKDAYKDAYNHYIQNFKDIKFYAEWCLEEENKKLFKSKKLITNLENIINICGIFKD